MRRLYSKVHYVLALIFVVSSLQAQNVFKTTSGSVIGYLEYVPPGYDSTSDKYPLVIFLHGIGERGVDSTDPAVLMTSIAKVEKLGPPAYVKSGTQFPFILVSPQLKSSFGTWTVSYVMEVINYVKTYLRVDEKRIYLTGLSLGGGGTWVSAQDHASLFAAIAPVCGGYNTPSKACNIASENLPVWAFHGDADTVVPLSRSTNMVNAINNCSPKPDPLAKLTIYTGVGHDAWKYAYRTDHSMHNPNVYEWMLSYTNSLNGGNAIPTADAGADQQISGTSATLTGDGRDADGSIASFVWDQIGGPSQAVLQNRYSRTVSFLDLLPGDYFFRLTVRDNSGNTDSDYVRVRVSASFIQNKAPVVDAGNNRTITLPTNSISLSGSATDSDGTVVKYQWTQLSGPAATLTGTTTKTMKVYDMLEGIYVFRLTATDDKGASASDDMQVTVRPANIFPIVDAGADVVIDLPVSAVELNGQASDPDGFIASYAWTMVSGGTLTMTGAATTTLNVASLTEGTYVFRFTATDNRGASSSDDVQVTVHAAKTLENIFPVASAGPNMTIEWPTNSVTIYGSGQDADGTIVSYSWMKAKGGSATLIGENTPTLQVRDLEIGSYYFRLTVTDDRGATHSDMMLLNVKDGSTSIYRLPRIGSIPGTDSELGLSVRVR